MPFSVPLSQLESPTALPLHRAGWGRGLTWPRRSLVPGRSAWLPALLFLASRLPSPLRVPLEACGPSDPLLRALLAGRPGFSWDTPRPGLTCPFGRCHPEGPRLGPRLPPWAAPRCLQAASPAPGALAVSSGRAGLAVLSEGASGGAPSVFPASPAPVACSHSAFAVIPLPGLAGTQLALSLLPAVALLPPLWVPCLRSCPSAPCPTLRSPRHWPGCLRSPDVIWSHPLSVPMGRVQGGTSWGRA